MLNARQFLNLQYCQQLLRRLGASSLRLFSCSPSLAVSSAIACSPSLAGSSSTACLPSLADRSCVAFANAPADHAAIPQSLYKLPPPLAIVLSQLDSAVCPDCMVFPWPSFGFSAFFPQAGMAAPVLRAQAGVFAVAFRRCTATCGSKWCPATFTAASAGFFSLSLAKPCSTMASSFLPSLLQLGSSSTSFCGIIPRRQDPYRRRWATTYTAPPGDFSSPVRRCQLFLAVPGPFHRPGCTRIAPASSFVFYIPGLFNPMTFYLPGDIIADAPPPVFMVVPGSLHQYSSSRPPSPPSSWTARCPATGGFSSFYCCCFHRRCATASFHGGPRLSSPVQQLAAAVAALQLDRPVPSHRRFLLFLLLLKVIASLLQLRWSNRLVAYCQRLHFGALLVAVAASLVWRSSCRCNQLSGVASSVFQGHRLPTPSAPPFLGRSSHRRWPCFNFIHLRHLFAALPDYCSGPFSSVLPLRVQNLVGG